MTVNLRATVVRSTVECRILNRAEVRTMSCGPLILGKKCWSLTPSREVCVCLHFVADHLMLIIGTKLVLFNLIRPVGTLAYGNTEEKHQSVMVKNANNINSFRKVGDKADTASLLFNYWLGLGLRASQTSH